jgi:hypothetical protein
MHLREVFRLAELLQMLVNSPFPLTEILCQIKNRIKISDSRDLDILECVLNYVYQTIKRLEFQISGPNDPNKCLF